MTNKKRGPGRPPTGEPRRVHVAVYVTPELLEKIDAAAFVSSRAAWVLDAIMEKLSREGKL